MEVCWTGSSWDVKRIRWIDGVTRCKDSRWVIRAVCSRAYEQSGLDI